MKTKVKLAAAIITAIALSSCAGTLSVLPDGTTTFTPTPVLPAK